MIHRFALAAFLLLTVQTLATASVFASLVPGKTKSDDLKEIFSDVKVIEQSGDRKTFDCHNPKKKIESICTFQNGVLYRYSIFYQTDSPELEEFGGWDALVDATIEKLGSPQQNPNDERMQWAISQSRMLIFEASPEQKNITYIDDAVRKKHTAVEWSMSKRVKSQKVFGGPYYLKGWKPKWTKWVTLTQGTYTIEGRHKGSGNFIVHMVSHSDKTHLFNEIGHSYNYEIIYVSEPTKPVCFLVKNAGGPWEINIKKR